ncbi:MAG: hypothetical protein HY887_04560 [Deltaproteobacteria bacterium]|nr:hypothetical protein [Deltaproteobacteria bacterium]
MAFLIIGFMVFWSIAPLSSEAIHRGAGGLVCGGCHTIHNSQGGSSLGGQSGGSIRLLRAAVSTKSEIHKLCLQCHATNGSRATDIHPPQSVQAPKVWSSASWTLSDPFNKIGAGGNFSPEIDSSWTATTTATKGYGHSIGATNVTPPGGDTLIESFTCTNCHDPHGTANTANTEINIFRNLRVSAQEAGTNSGVKFATDPTYPYFTHRSYVGGVNGTYFGGAETDNGGNVIWPVYRGTLTGDPASDGANSNAYSSDTCTSLYGIYCGSTYPMITISRWCAQCHDNWHEGLTANRDDSTCPGSEVDCSVYSYTLRQWKRHPVNTSMMRKAAPSCATVSSTETCHPNMLDRTNYTTALIQAGKGLPVTASKFYSGYVYYLPYEPPCSGDATCMDTPLNAGTHKVFCLTCHFAHGGPYYDNLRWNHTSTVEPDTPQSNPVPKDVGCQQCHNRGGV